MGRGVQRSDILAQQDADASVRWSNAVRGALFARIRSVVRHLSISERLRVSLWVTSTTEAVIAFGTRKDELLLTPETFACFDSTCHRPPTLDDLPPRLVDEDESVIQPVLDHSIKPTTPPDAANAHALSPPSVTTPMALPEVARRPVSAPTSHPRVTIRLPERGMNRPAAC